MNAATANLINAIVLILIGGWGAYATQLNSMTALIPVVGGVILLLCNNGVKKENKVIAHIAVVVTLLLIFGLIRPFMNSIQNGNTMATIRTSLMLLTGVIAMIYFVRSFINARKNKA